MTTRNGLHDLADWLAAGNPTDPAGLRLIAAIRLMADMPADDDEEETR